MKNDPYLNYLDKFFTRWISLYDYFALSIFNVYSSTVAAACIGSPHEVLDICTGTGEVALRLSRRGINVTGVDVTEVMLNEAKVKAKKLALKIEFKLMDARHLEFQDKSFDVVVIANALHDMPRKVRVEVLKEAKRVARKKLIITDYDFPRQPLIFSSLLKLVGLFETPYFPSYVKEGIEPLLREAGVDLGVSTRVFPGLFSVRVVI